MGLLAAPGFPRILQGCDGTARPYKSLNVVSFRQSQLYQKVSAVVIQSKWRITSSRTVSLLSIRENSQQTKTTTKPRNEIVVQLTLDLIRGLTLFSRHATFKR